LTYLNEFSHREALLNAMDRSTLYFRLSVIWLALLAAGLAFALLQ
jgi:hypothetical protein